MWAWMRVKEASMHGCCCRRVPRCRRLHTSAETSCQLKWCLRHKLFSGQCGLQAVSSGVTDEMELRQVVDGVGMDAREKGLNARLLLQARAAVQALAHLC